MARHRRIEDEAILSATRRLSLERGPQVSTREIAKELRISEGVIFQRFGSKEELLRAAHRLPHVDAAQVVEKAATGASACEVLENIAVAIFLEFRRLLPLYVPLIARVGLDPERTLAGRTSPLSMFRASLESHLIGERHAGRIRTESPHLAAHLIVSALHDAALLEVIDGASQEASQGSIRDLVRILWKGLEKL